MAVTQTLSVTEVSGSVNNTANTSKVRILWQSTQTGDSWNGYTRTAKYYISINGGAETPYSVSYTLPQNSTKTIVDTTITVTHNGDGTGSVKVRTWMDTSISAGVVELNKTLNLTTIPRASTITSAADRTLGTACAVKWTPLSQSFRYKLKFTIGDFSYTTGAIHPNTLSAYTYTSYALPIADIAPKITGKPPTGTMTVTLYTYSDSGATTQIGSASSKTFTVTVPNDSTTKPSVTMTLTPVSSLASQFSSLYIQGKSMVKATITGTGKYSASIVSYELYVDGKSNGKLQSDYLSKSGTVTVKGRVYDSRGFYNDIEKSITVIPYSKPSVLPKSNESAVICARCDKDGNLTESGTYLKIKAKRDYRLCKSNGVQTNFCELRFRYKKVTDSAYSSWVTLLGAKTLTTDEVDSIQMNGALLTTASYMVEVDAVDDVGQHSYVTFDIPTDKVYWHRAGSKNSLGLGKYAERDNALDSEWDLYMNDHRITGLPTPTDDTDAVPKSYVDAADIKISKNLISKGWYKIGTLSGGVCAVATLTIGGMFMYNPVSPSMVDIATQYDNARAFVRFASLANSPISKIGVVKESHIAYGVYLYYDSAQENSISINIHTHIGTFASADFVVSSVTESGMLAVVGIIA